LGTQVGVTRRISASEIRSAVRSALVSQLDTDAFTDDDPLFDLALDSIDVIVVVNTLEDRLGMHVSDADLFREECWSVSTLVRMFTSDAAGSEEMLG
jgi:acyl carrier protein